jgi:hypothetical protein
MLDALPIGRAVHCVLGGYASVDLYFRDEANAAIVRAGVSTWDFRVYSDQGAAPETDIFDDLAKANTATNAIDSSVIWEAAVVQDGKNRLPVGRTFLHKFDPSALFQAGAGQNYTLEYRVLRTSLPTLVTRVALVMEPAYQ